MNRRIAAWGSLVYYLQGFSLSLSPPLSLWYMPKDEKLLSRYCWPWNWSISVFSRMSFTWSRSSDSASVPPLALHCIWWVCQLIMLPFLYLWKILWKKLWQIDRDHMFIILKVHCWNNWPGLCVETLIPEDWLLIQVIELWGRWNDCLPPTPTIFPILSIWEFIAKQPCIPFFLVGSESEAWNNSNKEILSSSDFWFQEKIKT